MAEDGSSNVTTRLDEIAEASRAGFAEAHERRERALRASRATIQLASRSIRATHRGELDTARALWQQARDEILPAAAALRDQRQYLDGSLLHDAEKEYAEAALMLALMGGENLPGPAELEIGAAAYLRGLCEAASELRRATLDALRKGDGGRADELLSQMDAVYEVLVTIDFPEALTHGLRRSTDQLRGVLERTRGDVTLAIRQMALEQRLAGRVDGANG